MRVGSGVYMQNSPVTWDLYMSRIAASVGRPITTAAAHARLLSEFAKEADVQARCCSACSLHANGGCNDDRRWGRCGASASIMHCREREREGGGGRSVRGRAMAIARALPIADQSVTSQRCARWSMRHCMRAAL